MGELEQTREQLKQLDQLLNEYERTHDRSHLVTVQSELKQMAPKLKSIAQNPEYKIPENAVKFLEFKDEMKQVIERSKKLSNLRNSMNLDSISKRNSEYGAVRVGSSEKQFTRSMSVQHDTPPLEDAYARRATSNVQQHDPGMKTTQDLSFQAGNTINLEEWSGSHEVKTKPPPFKGWLRKQGEDIFKGWKKRWFVQHLWKLDYFKSDVTQEALGSIEFGTMKKIAIVNDPRFTFHLTTDLRVYILQAENQIEMERMIRGIVDWKCYFEYESKANEASRKRQNVRNVAAEAIDEQQSHKEETQPETKKEKITSAAKKISAEEKERETGGWTFTPPEKDETLTEEFERDEERERREKEIEEAMREREKELEREREREQIEKALKEREEERKREKESERQKEREREREKEKEIERQKKIEKATEIEKRVVTGAEAIRQNKSSRDEEEIQELRAKIEKLKLEKKKQEEEASRREERLSRENMDLKKEVIREKKEKDERSREVVKLKGELERETSKSKVEKSFQSSNFESARETVGLREELKKAKKEVQDLKDDLVRQEETQRLYLECKIELEGALEAKGEEKKKKKELEGKISELETRYEIEKRTQKDRKHKLEDDLAEYKQRVNCYAASQKVLEEETGRLKETVAGLERTSQSLATEKEMLEKKVSSMAKAQDKPTIPQSVLDSVEGEVKKLKTELEVYKETGKEERKKRRDAEEIAEEWKFELDKEREKREREEERNRKSAEEFVVLQNQLEKAKRTTHELEEELLEYQRSKKSEEKKRNAAGKSGDALFTDLISAANLSEAQHDAVVSRMEAYLQSFWATEEQVYSLKDTVNELEGNLGHSRKQQQGLRSEYDKLLAEYEAKDKYVHALKSQIEGANLGGGRGGGGRPLEELKAEVMKLRETSQAHKTQAALLGKQMQLQSVEHRTDLESKNETIAQMKKELSDVRKNYQELRRIQMVSKGYKESDMDLLQDIKRELFVTLALFIKFTLADSGAFCNVNVLDLYDEAKDMDYTEWKGWINRRYQQGMSNLSRDYTSSKGRNLGGGGGSSSGYRAPQSGPSQQQQQQQQVVYGRSTAKGKKKRTVEF